MFKIRLFRLTLGGSRLFLLRNFSGILFLGGVLSLFFFKSLGLMHYQLLACITLMLLFLWQRHHISNQVLITISASIIAVLFIGCNVWNITRQFFIISLIGIGLLILTLIYCFDCLMRFPRKYLD